MKSLASIDFSHCPGIVIVKLVRVGRGWLPHNITVFVNWRNKRSV